MASSTNNDEEEYDSFRVDVPALVLDANSMNFVRGTGRAGGTRGRGGGGSLASQSAATTQLATELGSVFGPRQDAFLKSITFFNPKVYSRRVSQRQAGKEEEKKNESSTGEGQHTNDYNAGGDDDVTFKFDHLTHWDILLRYPTTDELQQKKRGVLGTLRKVGDSLKKTKSHFIVEDFEGLVEFSSVEAGDRLLSINRKKIKPEEYSAKDAMAYMRQCLEKDGVLNVMTENPHDESFALFSELPFVWKSNSLDKYILINQGEIL